MTKPRDAPRSAHAELTAFALALPGAYEDHPWGEIVAKVAKKVFVFFGTAESREGGFGLCVKLPESGLAALTLPFVEPAGYGLGKSGWVYVRLTGKGALPVPMFKDWILESYRAVAPKKLAAAIEHGEPVEMAIKKAAIKRPLAKRAAAKRPPSTTRRS
jgi:predicted DNA-binding protein (MmcQ/YjbR family)